MDERFVPENSTGPQLTFERFLAEGRFMIQRAHRTGEYVFYPKVMSPTGETDLEWVEASGGGTVYAITVARKRDGAFNVALIDLDEGPRMMSTIAGVERLPIGARVRARVELGETARVVFDPEEK
ncbi:OB-fold domain-containing protein [Bradyrhizobium arachidis]|uniref:Zn-ribbon domain-containing OB-fold protein n=1 Tax=Bradyrhizobium arachidis TaxID=858423 RepID=UPI0021632E81|nr:OB-fold domain-containing protein [Bradyrhizobium arachidis]UVO35760.1 OB-fold domain-containing protein [Bradyrhizobium arachidis]